MPAQDLIPHLVELSGKSSGRVHPLPYGDHVIGRASDASVRLDDNDVSRRHARLEVGPDGMVLHDLESKNGVVIDGARIEGPTALRDGQTFAFGDLTVRVSHPAARVAGVLAAAGEATATSTRTVTSDSVGYGGLALPIIGVLAFGILVVAMLLV